VKSRTVPTNGSCFAHLDISRIIYPDWVTFRKHVQWMFITGLSIGLATDFLIAFAISFYLLRGRDISVPSYVVEPYAVAAWREFG
jgi:hypothetical protein